MRAVLVMVCLLLAGCNSPDAEAPTTTFEGEVEETDGGAVLTNGTGTVAGVVRNAAGARLADAHVLVFGLATSVTTGSQGDFVLVDVPPGMQTLRVNRAGYLSLERQITVQDGRVTHLNVTLATNTPGGPGFREHLHDLWRGAQEIVLFDGVVRHGHTYPPAGTNLAPCARAGTASLSGGKCYDIPLVPDEEKIVPPGAASMSFWVDWDNTQFVPDVQFYYQPANASGLLATASLAPQESVTIPISHPMPDHGHQLVTQWNLLLHAEPRAGPVSFSSQHVNEEAAGDFLVRIVVHRGDELPAEEPHPRYWAQGDRLTLLETTRTLAGLPRDRIPSATVCIDSAACFLLPEGTVVPSGTTRLLVTLEYEPGTPQLAPYLSGKTLAFRTAAVSPGKSTLETLRVDTPIEATVGRTVYELELGEGEPDPFYQARSNWMFLLANEGDERGQKFYEDCYHFIAGCGGTTYTLTVVAINDDWTPELAGIEE